MSSKDCFMQFVDSTNRCLHGTATLTESIANGAKLGEAMGKTEVVAEWMKNAPEEGSLNIPAPGFDALKGHYAYTNEVAQVGRTR